MTKITADHLGRGAFVYIRQSTADQLLRNLESRRRQYGLADRARQLGWTTVEVIDDDLGRSGGGIKRPGFERLLAAICEGRVGAVFAIETSRLARNGRDWHTLIEFCGLVGTVIVDEDGIYDPRHPNDRLLLGMGHHERARAVALSSALAGSAEAESAPRCLVSQCRGRLCEGWARPDREGPGPARAGSSELGLRQVCRTPQRSSGARLAARRGHCVARRMP